MDNIVSVEGYYRTGMGLYPGSEFKLSIIIYFFFHDGLGRMGRYIYCFGEK